MPAATETTAAALSRAKTAKRLNVVAAISCGLASVVPLAFAFPSGPGTYLAGLLLGIVWANGFEYAYHRYLLHLPGNLFARYHLQHHAVTGTPDEAEWVNFGKSPSLVVLVFALNAAPVVAADWLWRFRIAPGVLAAFSLYYVALEEIHWRIHLGKWLPPGLRLARTYHLAHHDSSRQPVQCLLARI
jgi:hypothetical protein